MTQLAILKLTGTSFDQDWSVELTISREGAAPHVQVSGKLPPPPDLVQQYHYWRESYRGMSQPIGEITSVVAHETSAFYLDESTFRLGKPSAFRLGKPKHQTTNLSIDEVQQDCRDRTQVLTDCFNTWLNESPKFWPVRDTFLTHIPETAIARLVIQVDDFDLQRLPWHLWNVLAKRPAVEVAISAASWAKVGTRSPDPKVNVLAILGNSEGIDIQKDRQFLEALPHADVTFLAEPDTIKEVTDALTEKHWDIFFFAGHSSSQGTGKIFINQTDYLTIDNLKYSLSRAIQRGLQLAIFNSCDGIQIARDIAALNIPQTIFMREPVPDKVAQTFLKAFLQEFSQGNTLYQSVRVAREALEPFEKAEVPCATWLPMLFQNLAEIPPTWEQLRGDPPEPPVEPPTPRSRTRQLLLSGLMSLAVTGAIAGIRHTGLLRAWEWKAYDHLLALRSTLLPEKPDERLLVVEIDTQSYVAWRQQDGARSLSDENLAKLITKLNADPQNRPAAIGIDLFRSSQTLPKPIAKVLKTAPNLFGICEVPNERNPNGSPMPQSFNPRHIGFADTVLDADRVLRRHLAMMPPETGSPCQPHYAFNMLATNAYLTNQSRPLKFTSEGWVQFGDHVLPPMQERSGMYASRDMGGYQFLLNYRSGTIPTISISQFLNQEVDAKILKGRIVLVGATHGYTTDMKKTPYRLASASSEQVPGVMVQAHMISQILSAVIEGRPLIWVWPQEAEILWIAGWSLVSGSAVWCTYRIIAMRSTARLGGAIAIVSTSSILYLASSGILIVGTGWVPLIPAGLGILLSGCISGLLLER